MIENWRGAFTDRILERGRNCWRNGQVAIKTANDTTCSATVAGTQVYRVSVPMSGALARATCTCPHFAKGNMCKHIAAVLYALEAGDSNETCVESPVQDTQDISSRANRENILDMMSEDDLRGFVRELMGEDERLERRVLSRMGVVDLKQAKSDLRKLTTDLMRTYEHSGMIDWRYSLDFENEYLAGVDDIVEPFRTTQDVDGLMELVVVRLMQLQRIRIDDSDGFFSTALYPVRDDMKKAFIWADVKQRRKMLQTLNSFLQKKPGTNRNDMYWFLEDCVQGFLLDAFPTDPELAQDVIAMADSRIAELPAQCNDRGYDRNGADRRQWKMGRLMALSSTDASFDELTEAADELLGEAKAVRVLSDALLREGRVDEALGMLRDNVDAFDERRRGDDRPPRVVDRLIELTEQYKPVAEREVLLTWLLQNPPGKCSAKDLETWYDALHGLTGEQSWSQTRGALMATMPAGAKQTCLAHEDSLDELYECIMADGGGDLWKYESLLSDRYPQAYLELYLDQARFELNNSRDRREYNRAARALKKVVAFEGGFEIAQAEAEAVVAANPRKTALADELRKVGFAV
ncbi:Uncharacterized conserved protein [Slackia heliotrinireducens]|uniref:Uncharacterized conserved protein n=2 Tax=Slackia TaxID=84108 RepID=C7N2W4_SLAHD|nr:SWIM zinc finger family protein [Slackia heliotrinireducens]ACV21485.1 uncharacterized conserved protein [Slackia heliotrinireducens DSM 20476]VEG98924.1 Uncharacterized conserved protein [Slackia heliotrinireducens]